MTDINWSGGCGDNFKAVLGHTPLLNMSNENRSAAIIFDFRKSQTVGSVYVANPDEVLYTRK